MSKFNIGADEWPGISKLVEESGELLQVAGRVVQIAGMNGDVRRHWDGSDLVDDLEKEMADVFAAIDFVTDHAGLNRQRILDRATAKRALYDHWHAEQKNKETK